LYQQEHKEGKENQPKRLNGSINAINRTGVFQFMTSWKCRFFRISLDFLIRSISLTLTSCKYQWWQKQEHKEALLFFIQHVDPESHVAVDMWDSKR
jgi:hypothetical protein